MTTKDRRELESKLPFYITKVENGFPVVKKVVIISRSFYYTDKDERIAIHSFPDRVFSEKEAIDFKVDTIKSNYPTLKEVLGKMELEMFNNPSQFI